MEAFNSNHLVVKYFDAFGEHQKSWAASIQSLTYSVQLARTIGASSILDAGSGVSTVFFNSELNNVSTIDDDPAWAQKTVDFVSLHLKKQIEIARIDSILNNRYDFVFYDYGHIETRIFYFRHALELCKKAIYIDDMHIGFYSEYVKSRSKKYKLKILNETMDEYGRYGAVIIKD